MVRLNKQAMLSPEFLELWSKIKQKTAYRVSIFMHLKTSEQLKIHCGKEHFKALNAGVALETATSWTELRERLEIVLYQKGKGNLDQVRVSLFLFPFKFFPITLRVIYVFLILLSQVISKRAISCRKEQPFHP